MTIPRPFDSAPLALVTNGAWGLGCYHHQRLAPLSVAAVDQNRFIFEVLVQKHFNIKAAKHFIRKLLSGQIAAPRIIMTDKLGSYGAANRELSLQVVIIVSIKTGTTEPRIHASRYDEESGT